MQTVFLSTTKQPEQNFCSQGLGNQRYKKYTERIRDAFGSIDGKKKLDFLNYSLTVEVFVDCHECI